MQFAAVVDLQRKIAHESAGDAVLLAEVEALPASIFETDVAADSCGRALPERYMVLCHDTDGIGSDQ